MNDGVTLSTFQFFAKFPDAESTRTHLEALRWKDGVVCPHCESKRVSARPNGFYRCCACRHDFTVRTGTIFHRSHVPLNKWFYAIYLLLTARKGISSMQLSKQLSVTQTTAWFMQHRIREACESDVMLAGIIEVDETYVGGKEKNKHANKRHRLGRGTSGKIPVFGMRERGGRVRAMPVPQATALRLKAEIHQAVEPGSTIYSDEAAMYVGLDQEGYGHDSVRHGAGEYIRDGVGTNGIESVWAVVKRGLNGVYHKASPKHLGRYVNEFAFRLNEGNVKRPTLERLDSLLAASVGKRITYAELTA